MPKIFLIRQELELQHQQLSGSIKNQEQPAPVFSWDIKSSEEKYLEEPEDCSSGTKYQQREDTEPAIGECSFSSYFYYAVSQSNSLTVSRHVWSVVSETFQRMGDNLISNR